MVAIDPHPLLDAAIVALDWPQPMGGLDATAVLDPLVRPDAPTPLEAPGAERKAQVRDLLRHGGFKPNGRNKPCNEYIVRVAADDRFPRINAAVDLTNVAVLHSGLPISTVDRDLVAVPLRIGIADKGASYVFNPSGQVLDLSGLLCLFDTEGPCANSVKDSQRAKTTDASTRTLTVIWGISAWPGRTRATAAWFTEVAEQLGGAVRID